MQEDELILCGGNLAEHYSLRMSSRKPSWCLWINNEKCEKYTYFFLPQVDFFTTSLQVEDYRVKVALLREQLEAEIDQLRALKLSADNLDNQNQEKG